MMLKALISFLLLSVSVCAQEFSYKIKFTDAIGNKDSLIIGYDIDATDSIDAAFGEVNIIATTINPVFDVRLSNEWNNRTFHNSMGTFHTKKNIIQKKECDNFNVQSIDIYAKYWPVTAIWDSILFNTECLKKSYLTSMVNDDVATPSNLYTLQLKVKNAVTFTSNMNADITFYGYVIAGNDTISTFWTLFLNNQISAVEKEVDRGVLNVYPNPFEDELKVFDQLNSVNSYEIYNSYGSKLQQSVFTGNPINTKNLEEGLYIFILNTKEKKYLFKITKY